jgi:amino acid transporter
VLDFEKLATPSCNECSRPEGDAMARTAATDATPVFSRKASGLIRVAGGLDVFIYNIGLVSVGIAIALNQYYGPSLYPGVSVWISTLLATLGMLFVAATFYFWSVVFPRSGGVYVALSRGLHPGVAFVASLLETVILMYYAALAASLIVTVGLSSFFATVGALGGNATFVSWAAGLASPGGIFWTGSLILVLAAALLSSGTRRYFAVQRVLFVVAVLGTVVTAGVLLLGSRAAFERNLQELTGLQVQTVVATALENGWQQTGFDLGATVGFLVWPLLPLLGGVQSVALGGEIKKVSRAQLIGMLGAVAAAGLTIAAFAGLADRAFGFDLQGAIGWNSLNGLADASTEGSIGAAPWFTVLAGVLADNVLLAVVILATFVAWIWFWIPAEIAYTTRTMIAWSFDRLAPNRLGHVSERVGTPVVAIWLSAVVSIVFMWFIAYRAIALLQLIEGILLVWGLAMLAAVFFPFARRSFFDASPAAGSRVAGVPLMSVTGALAVAFFALAGYLLWTDPLAAGPLLASPLPPSFWIIAGVLVVGTAWYLGVRRYRRTQGIDIDLAFRQIPIE